MDLSVPPAATTELAAAYLQIAITLGLVGLCWALHKRYRKRYFGIWALAWIVYTLRLLAIVTFLHTGVAWWLFWHQVTTGWTALALLWAALVFSQNLEWKPRYLAWVVLPVAWSYVAIYVLDSFLWAALPMVAFLSVTTGWTAWAFYRYDRLVRSPAARLLVVVLVLWALHHLDYPFLRAQGVWNPWGYYLDIVFEVGVGLGILFLVLEDLDQGLRTLTALSAELQGAPRNDESTTEAVLRRALALRGVHGSALYLSTDATDHDVPESAVVKGGRFVHGAGVAALWPFEKPPPTALESAERVCSTGAPVAVNDPGAGGADASWTHAYTAALPILRDERVVGALVVVGEARDPFTVLDNRFLLGFGQQVGASLANERLHRNLEARTEELERLQSRMVRQHEEERNRIWRELHDETAQVLAALNMQLGMLEERGGPDLASALERAKTLVGDGIRSIRSVTRNLRPKALDDLGLVPSLRALVRDFEEQGSFEIEFRGPAAPLPTLPADAEVALYRTLQEGLANATRHAGASRVDVALAVRDGTVSLTVEDDGTGFSDDAARRLRSRGGLAGIRERITSLGGEFEMENTEGGGARVRVSVPTDTGVPQGE
ncbi:MAG: GAF domain-containing sensor histidine kinase [Gemmatimonadota bacterium]|nr:GAF domain-containing sensor histidine kinase [Gemmatimonadota bacterium]